MKDTRMTSPSNVDFLIDGKGVAWVMLDRSGHRNALSLQLLSELRARIAEVKSDSRARVMVIAGKGKHFCAGADIEWLHALTRNDREEWNQATTELMGLLSDLAAFDRPLVTYVHGNAVGAGAALAAISDIVVAHREARFLLPELNLGMVPSLVAPPLFARMSPMRAKRLLLEGRPVTATTALELGLVDYLSEPGDDAESALVGILRQLLTVAPEAASRFKRMCLAMSGSYDRLFDIAASVTAEIPEHREAMEGIEAYLDKRSPVWHIPGGTE